MEYLFCSITDEDNKGSSSEESCIKVITPRNPADRGAQLSLMFPSDIDKCFAELSKRGVIVSNSVNARVARGKTPVDKPYILPSVRIAKISSLRSTVYRLTVVFFSVRNRLISENPMCSELQPVRYIIPSWMFLNSTSTLKNAMVSFMSRNDRSRSYAKKCFNTSFIYCNFLCFLHDLNTRKMLQNVS